MVARIRTLLETRQLTPTQFADVIGVARPIVSHILSGRNKPSLEVVQRILAAMPDLSMPWLLNGTGPMQATAGGAPVVGAAPAAPLAAVALPAPATAASVSQVEETEEHAHYKFNDLSGSNLGGNMLAPVAAPVPAPAVRYQSGAPSPLPPPAPTPVLFSAAAMPTATPKAHPLPRRFAPLPKRGSAPIEVPAPALAPVSAPIPVVPMPAIVPVGDVAPLEAIAARPEVPARELAAEPVLAPTPSNATAVALFAGSEKPIRRIVIFYCDGSFADYQPE